MVLLSVMKFININKNKLNSKKKKLNKKKLYFFSQYPI